MLVLVEWFEFGQLTIPYIYIYIYVYVGALENHEKESFLTTYFTCRSVETKNRALNKFSIFSKLKAKILQNFYYHFFTITPCVRKLSSYNLQRNELSRFQNIFLEKRFLHSTVSSLSYRLHWKRPIYKLRICE